VDKWRLRRYPRLFPELTAARQQRTLKRYSTSVCDGSMGKVKIPYYVVIKVAVTGGRIRACERSVFKLFAAA
jgi:hypothetical protein